MRADLEERQEFIVYCRFRAAEPKVSAEEARALFPTWRKLEKRYALREEIRQAHPGCFDLPDPAQTK